MEHLIILQQEIQKMPSNWVEELASFILAAQQKKNKLIRSNYGGYIFTPLGLVKCIRAGRFRWGVENWTLVENSPTIKVDFGD